MSEQDKAMEWWSLQSLSRKEQLISKVMREVKITKEDNHNVVTVNKETVLKLYKMNHYE